MRVSAVHCTTLLRFVCGAVTLSALAGCWKEIHYTGPDPTAKRKPAAARSDDTDDTGRFADELASSPQLDRASNDRPDRDSKPPTLRERPLEADSSESSAESEVGDLFSDVERADDADDQPAPAASATENQPPPTAVEPQHNTRRLAWLLGSKLSLAALKNDRGAAAKDVAELFEQSQTLAKLLGTSTGELPPPTASAESGRAADQALNYLFGEGRTIGRSLAERQGDDHAALFELAVKSNVLLALYRPEAPIVGTLSGAIRQTSQRAKLPPELSQPLLDKLERGAPAAEVQEAVFAMYAEVDRHLKSEAAP